MYLVGSGVAVSCFQTLAEAFQELRSAFRDNLYAAVGKVADQAFYAETVRFAGGPGAETHALNSAGNYKVKRVIFVR